MYTRPFITILIIIQIIQSRKKIRSVFGFCAMALTTITTVSECEALGCRMCEIARMLMDSDDEEGAIETTRYEAGSDAPSSPSPERDAIGDVDITSSDASAPGMTLGRKPLAKNLTVNKRVTLHTGREDTAKRARSDISIMTLEEQAHHLLHCERTHASWDVYVFNKAKPMDCSVKSSLDDVFKDAECILRQSRPPITYAFILFFV